MAREKVTVTDEHGNKTTYYREKSSSSDDPKPGRSRMGLGGAGVVIFGLIYLMATGFGAPSGVANIHLTIALFCGFIFLIGLIARIKYNRKYK